MKRLRPSAEVIARALVLAAAQTDESHRLEAATASVAVFRCEVLRARWVALEALNLLYPKCSVAWLARKLGCPTQWADGFAIALRSAWWPHDGVAAVLRGL